MTTIPVLLYHSVSSNPAPWIAPYTVTPATFAAHVDLIRENGLTAMTVSDLCLALTGQTVLPHRPVAITFDDGFADFTDAVEILDASHLPSTLYVTTGALRGRGPRPDNMAIPPAPMLHWSQLAELGECNVEIGAHTHTHPQLDAMPKSAVVDEVQRSKELLEDEVGHPVTSFAYPHGFNCAQTRRVVQSAGFTSACAVMDALSSSRDCVYSLARLTVRADTTRGQLSDWLNGHGARTAPYPERVQTVAWRMYRRARRGKATRGIISTDATGRIREPVPTTTINRQAGDH